MFCRNEQTNEDSETIAKRLCGGNVLFWGVFTRYIKSEWEGHSPEWEGET